MARHWSYQLGSTERISFTDPLGRVWDITPCEMRSGGYWDAEMPLEDQDEDTPCIRSMRGLEEVLQEIRRLAWDDWEDGAPPSGACPHCDKRAKDHAPGCPDPEPTDDLGRTNEGDEVWAREGLSGARYAVQPGVSLPLPWRRVQAKETDVGLPRVYALPGGPRAPHLYRKWKGGGCARCGLPISSPAHRIQAPMELRSQDVVEDGR